MAVGHHQVSAPALPAERGDERWGALAAAVHVGFGEAEADDGLGDGLVVHKNL